MRSVNDIKFLGKWIRLGWGNYYDSYFCIGESKNHVHVFYKDKTFCYLKSNALSIITHHGMESDINYFPSKDGVEYDRFEELFNDEKVRWYKK
jgi:hypothetical protein